MKQFAQNKQPMRPLVDLTRWIWLRNALAIVAKRLMQKNESKLIQIGFSGKKIKKRAIAQDINMQQILV